MVVFSISVVYIKEELEDSSYVERSEYERSERALNLSCFKKENVCQDGNPDQIIDPKLLAIKEESAEDDLVSKLLY